ncbi:MAG: GntR family transcriptional regulator [Candidatus Sumerlaeia bacterium]
MRKLQTFVSKSQLVHQSLLEAILDGDIAPGERLNIREIANQLGVSHIPVREAIQQLESEGLAQSTPNVGPRVTELSLRSINETFELLESVEAACVRAAAENMSNAQIDELREILDEMDQAKSDSEVWAAANTRFHRAIGEHSGAPLARVLLPKVLLHWERLRRHYFRQSTRSRIQTAQKEHKKLFRALRKRDATEAESIIRAHNQSARRAYESRAKKIKEPTSKDTP